MDCVKWESNVYRDDVLLPAEYLDRLARFKVGGVFGYGSKDDAAEYPCLCKSSYYRLPVILGGGPKYADELAKSTKGGV